MGCCAFEVVIMLCERQVLALSFSRELHRCCSPISSIHQARDSWAYLLKRKCKRPWLLQILREIPSA